MKKISMIAPVYNEEAVLDTFFATLEPILGRLAYDYEIICINDGSTDRTEELLLSHRERNSRIKIINFSRNFGKEAAMAAGFRAATGDAMVPIDTDLQDPPELLYDFIEKWEQGYEVVYGVRASRTSDHLFKRTSAGWFYRLFNKLSQTAITPDAGDYRLLDRKAVDALNTLPEKVRFTKGLFFWVGFRQIGVPYVRPGRAGGRTKWNYFKLWNFALDGMTAFSIIPLRLWTYLGLGVAFFAFSYATFLIVRTLVFGRDVPGYASIMVVVLFLGGIQLISLGVIGEYLGRVFQEVKDRPLYIVRSIHGVDHERIEG